MPTWSLLLLFPALLWWFYLGVRGTVIEWPAMPLSKKGNSLFALTLWAGGTAYCGMVLYQRLF